MDKDNLSLKEVAFVIGPIIALLAGLILLLKGHLVLGWAILIPVSGVYSYAIIKTPWNEIAAREVEKEQEQKKYLLGKIWVAIKHIFGYVSIITLVLAIIGKFIIQFLNGS